MKTARTVVIDDDIKEAGILLQALGRSGVGAVYVAGDDTNLLPKPPLGGIRVVFLDLNLINQREAKQYIPHAVNVLQQTVEMIPGVTGIICWTKHIGEEVDLLRAELTAKGIKPAFVQAIEDKLSITRSETDGIPKIIKQLQQFAAKRPARQLLLDWEQSLHDAGSSTTNALFELVTEDNELMPVLSAIAVAVAEEKLTTPESAVDALFMGLSSIHTDALENIHEAARMKGAHTQNLKTSVDQLRRCPPSFEHRARLNKILLASDHLEQATPMPGNVYMEKDWNPTGEFPAALAEKEKRGFIREVYAKRSGDEADDEFVTGVTSLATPCMVEITPACDRASGKCPFARLLTGLLIKGPSGEESEDATTIPAESRLFSKDIAFVWLNNPGFKLDGPYKIVINARRLISVPFNQLATNRPILRLRHPVVADIRAWFAAHAARPGYVSVHKPRPQPANASIAPPLIQAETVESPKK